MKNFGGTKKQILLETLVTTPPLEKFLLVKVSLLPLLEKSWKTIVTTPSRKLPGCQLFKYVGLPPPQQQARGSRLNTAHTNPYSYATAQTSQFGPHVQLIKFLRISPAV